MVSCDMKSRGERARIEAEETVIACGSQAGINGSGVHSAPRGRVMERKFDAGAALCYPAI